MSAVPWQIELIGTGRSPPVALPLLPEQLVIVTLPDLRVVQLVEASAAAALASSASTL